MLFCPATEWDSVVRNRNMCIPAGHVRLFVPFGKFSDRTESATRNRNMFIPAGHVRPFLSPLGNLVTEWSLSQNVV
jgi:hypothetical protein